jgi:hypothetical protein
VDQLSATEYFTTQTAELKTGKWKKRAREGVQPDGRVSPEVHLGKRSSAVSVAVSKKAKLSEVVLGSHEDSNALSADRLSPVCRSP